ncbi:MAG: cytochrome C biogenesis protein CycH, partial [Alistipes sp.]|nr:cytochrome C biogenesis protein CycH [Alistipes sp.]
MKDSNSQIVIYQAEDGRVKIDVRLEKETVWLSQKMMADLFQTTVPNINMHLKNIYDEGELTQGATIKDFLIVQQEGARNVSRNVDF